MISTSALSRRGGDFYTPLDFTLTFYQRLKRHKYVLQRIQHGLDDTSGLLLWALNAPLMQWDSITHLRVDPQMRVRFKVPRIYRLPP